MSNNCYVCIITQHVADSKSIETAAFIGISAGIWAFREFGEEVTLKCLCDRHLSDVVGAQAVFARQWKDAKKYE